MIIDHGRPPARDAAVVRMRRTMAARLRGGSAGAVSGALSIAAHGATSGGMPVQTSTLALLVCACTVIGTLVMSVGALRYTLSGLIVALIGGQLLGHAVLSLGMAGMPHAVSTWSPAMISAHILAAVCAAVVIRAAESAYRVGATVLSWMAPELFRSPEIAGPSVPRTAYRRRVVPTTRPMDTVRPRGPPSLVRD